MTICNKGPSLPEHHKTANSSDKCVCFPSILTHRWQCDTTQLTLPWGDRAIIAQPRQQVPPQTPGSATHSPSKAEDTFSVIVYGERCQIPDLQRRGLSFGTRVEASDTQNFMWQKFYYSEKGNKASDIDVRRETESAPSLVLARELHTFSIAY